MSQYRKHLLADLCGLASSEGPPAKPPLWGVMDGRGNHGSHLKSVATKLSSIALELVQLFQSIPWSRGQCLDHSLPYLVLIHTESWVGWSVNELMFTVGQVPDMWLSHPSLAGKWALASCLYPGGLMMGQPARADLEKAWA